MQNHEDAPKWNIKQSPVCRMLDNGASGGQMARRFTQTVCVHSPQTRVNIGVAAKWRTRNQNMAWKLLYWSRSNWPDASITFPFKLVSRGGRIGAGQLDWAAAEPAEFVNQEIGYE
ncbi:hypothetical protein ACFQ3P_16790 [Paraburkholderia sabiae]|uniref:Uncharacterized protein n=1 Tax=Paraburkholderia sabiae TaxID=273251 RepID=A0ABU9Q9Y2_9BURK|nr:hypothetical protein [Paraburkholderia sabiae]WJZ75290.1 hypothetical protein QEN71_05660 [Paraburkholderia sabiae]